MTGIMTGKGPPSSDAGRPGDESARSVRVTLESTPDESASLEMAPAAYKDVVEAVAHPIFVKDRAHRWVMMNRAFEELIQKPRAQLLGRTDHDFLPKEEADFFHERDREVFESGKRVHVDAEPITVADGSTHILETTKVPIYEDGRVVYLVGIIHDITRIKLAEEELRVTGEELEARVFQRTEQLKNAQQALLRKERLIVLGQLTGGLAHQIRNPLAAISNAAAILRRRLCAKIDEESAQAFSILEEEVAEANRIISDLLDYASIRPPSRSPVGCSDLLEKALMRARPERNIEISKQVKTDPDVHVDERQTRDALGNVIRNAYEAVGERGTITLRVASEGSFARIEVEDTGPGVAREARVHLFEPLVSSKPLGLGLGLTTAKALIENQGGSIRYVQTEHGGARFDVLLPLVDESIKE